MWGDLGAQCNGVCANSEVSGGFKLYLRSAFFGGEIRTQPGAAPLSTPKLGLGGGIASFDTVA